MFLHEEHFEHSKTMNFDKIGFWKKNVLEKKQSRIRFFFAWFETGIWRVSFFTHFWVNLRVSSEMKFSEVEWSESVEWIDKNRNRVKLECRVSKKIRLIPGVEWSSSENSSELKSRSVLHIFGLMPWRFYYFWIITTIRRLVNIYACILLRHGRTQQNSHKKIFVSTNRWLFLKRRQISSLWAINTA